MKKITCGAFAAALLGTLAAPAFAADLPSTKSAPLAPIDDSFDPFLIRVRALGVLPDASGTTALNAPLAGAKLSDSVVPEVDATYFFSKHWAIEAIAAISHHRLTAGGTNVAIANTTLLPPTVTLQYHLALGQLDPYVGIGGNYTWFLATKPSVINIHPTAGLAFQFGADYYLTKHWTLNLDAKYLLLDADANVGAGALAGRNTVHLGINPWIIGGGVGYRFGGSDSAPVLAKY